VQEYVLRARLPAGFFMPSKEGRQMTSLFTVDEVAQTLRLAPRSVYERISSGELAAIRLGSGPKAPIRVTAEELDRYVTPATASEGH
jgi:excisionase family DNA binding protein